MTELAPGEARWINNSVEHFGHTHRACPDCGKTLCDEDHQADCPCRGTADHEDHDVFCCDSCLSTYSRNEDGSAR